MKQYLDFLQDILDNGVQKPDRTRTGTLAVFGRMMRFDLSKGFPLVTTKRVHYRSIIIELLWFLRGDTNIRYLTENGVTIWNEWANKDGELGAIYGKQWRAWETKTGETIDQMTRLINELKSNPHSRRHIVNAWNVAELDKMALPPCHLTMQFYVENGRLSCLLYQRSCDAFLGVPFNIASYALLTSMIAQQCDFQVGEFIWTGGDCHIYLTHLKQVKTQLQRAPFPLPALNIIRKPNSLFEYAYCDFDILDYQAHPSIKAPIAI